MKSALNARCTWSSCAHELESELRGGSISASVQGRPKHIYSIVKKMRGKSLNFDQLFDLRALRVVVPTVKDCYTTLSLGAPAFQADRVGV